MPLTVLLHLVGLSVLVVLAVALRSFGPGLFILFAKRVRDKRRVQVGGA